METPPLTLKQFTRHELTFEPTTHTYRWNGVECISVTTLVGLFKQPFDDQKMAAQKAREQARTKDDILAEWAHKRDTASEYGNRFHAGAAEIIRTKHQGWAVAEIPICLPEYLIAGTVDMIGAPPDGPRVITDWKTNRQIDLIGYNYMLPPLQVLFDSKWSHYSLQLSLYAHILRKNYDFDAQSLILYHSPLIGSPTHHTLIDYKQHVAKLLEWRAQHLDKQGDKADDLD